jgi:hypothetical protein
LLGPARGDGLATDRADGKIVGQAIALHAKDKQASVGSEEFWFWILRTKHFLFKSPYASSFFARFLTFLKISILI